jgi:hypothetical protein
MQHRNHRYTAEFDLLERLMPHARMEHAFGRVLLAQIGEIETGGKMLPSAVNDDRMDVVRERGEECLDAAY